MPPSGTLTVVVTVVNRNSGSCRVVPLDRCSISPEDENPLASPTRPVAPGTLTSAPDRSSLLLARELFEPSNWNSWILPICEKKGTSVSRTNRRSLETTASTFTAVPSLRTVITGIWAAANSPTTGVTDVTNGRCRVSETKAFWPLKSVTLGAWRTFDRVLPWAASMRKKASMSERIANPNEAAELAAAGSPGNCGTVAAPKLFCRNGIE